MTHSEMVKSLVDNFQLQPHPEGGFYKQTYVASEEIPQSALPKRFAGSRPFSTSIYFLLTKGNFSAFHKIQSDEGWHFYAGGSLEVIILHENGHLQIIRLGSDWLLGEQFQTTVPAGAWFASRCTEGVDYSLVGCTVAPGFDFTDFELAKRSKLIETYPEHAEIITELTRI